MKYGYDSCPECGKPKAIQASRCRKCYMAGRLRHLAYLVHLVDSGQSRLGALGLEVGRRMRGETPVRPCPTSCQFCEAERRVVAMRKGARREARRD